MKNLTRIICFILANFLWTACIKREKLNTIPRIEFISFTRDLENNKDYILFSFTDKEGDIGNVLLKYYVKTDTGYELLAIPDFFYEIRNISTEQDKATQGEISIILEPLFYPPNVAVVKFTIYLDDLAGHRSNPIETPDIQVP